MEDVFSVAYQQTEDEMDLEYAFFGIYDGHGGKEAALFAKVKYLNIFAMMIFKRLPFRSISWTTLQSNKIFGQKMMISC